MDYNYEVCESYQMKVNKLERILFGNGEIGLVAEVKANTRFVEGYKKIVQSIIVAFVIAVITQTFIITKQIKEISEITKAQQAQFQKMIEAN